VSTINELVKIKTPSDTSELPPEPGTPPFSGGDTTIIASPLADETDIEERPAWLSKLIGIDDVESPSPEKTETKPPEPTPIPTPVENADEISGASQAAWIVDMMSSTESEGQPAGKTTITPEEPPTSTVLPEIPIVPEGEPVAARAQVEPEIVSPIEQVMEPVDSTLPADVEPVTPPIESEPEVAAVKETPDVTSGVDFGEHEGVPDLSLIVEGLQAAWMSEHVEDDERKHTGSLMDIYAPKPDAGNSETIIIDRSGKKPVEPQPKQPQPEQAQPEELQPEPPQPVQLQPDELQPEPPQPVQTIPVPEMETPAPEPEIPVTLPVATAKKVTPLPVKHAQPVMAYPAEDILKDARAAYSHGVLDESLDRYVELLSRNRLVESVIEDLESMTNVQSDHSKVWQTLGDAYIRRNKLDQALSAYLKAEDLLK
jgi:hypothetical protein